MNIDALGTVDRRWLALFEDRYGEAAYERLLDDLRKPCVTFAAIARRFGVTRERVRQWQQLLLPDAPRGHERKRLCAVHRRRRRLLEDPLFRTFYRHARASLDSRRIEPILTHDRYRTRAIRIDRRIVALRAAQLLPNEQAGDARPTYFLSRCRWADFLYYQLTATDFLFLPAHALAVAGPRFVDAGDSRYSSYKNTFSALDTTPETKSTSSERPTDSGEVKEF